MANAATVDVLEGRAAWSCVESDSLAFLRGLPDACVNCCVTSPPYYGLRDYGHAGQIGLEPTPDEYVARLVAVFREVRRVLRDDGTLWLNLGDSYAASGRGGGGGSFQDKDVGREITQANQRRAPVVGYKQKDLLGIPWMVAFALRADGWYLRQDIIWAKPNPMPESVRDRCTKAHEYVFLLSKSATYHYDADAIAEPAVSVGGRACFGKQGHDATGTGAQSRTYDRPVYETRNKRSVWTITTKPYKGAHFATMPPELAETCVLAGCPAAGVVLEPFVGSGTTLAVAVKNGRRAIGSELNPDFVKLCERRLEIVTPSLFSEDAA